MKEDDLSNIIEGVKILEKLADGHLPHWRYVLENANSIWLKSPFKVGDLVQLVKDPEITSENSWGWLGAKHFLIKGAKARINERQFYDGKFIFGLSFEDESWIDSEGIVRQVHKKAIYLFGESWLESADYSQLTCEAL